MRISDWSSDVCSSDLLWYVEPTIQFGPPNDLKARLNGVKQVHVTCDRGTGFWKAWLALEPRRPLAARIVRAAKTIDRPIAAGPVRLADAARERDPPPGRLRHLLPADIRSDARSVGKECVRTVITGWSP